MKHSLLLLLCYAASAARAADSVPLYSPHEITLSASTVPANPYTDLAADCTLTAPDGGTRSLPLFWDGGTTWKFRFAPAALGTWKWLVKSTDAGLEGKTGAFQCMDFKLRGGLQPMRGAPHHFQHQNGERVWFVGDTAWSLFTDNDRKKHHRTSVERYLSQRASEGFTAVHSMLLNESGWSNSGGPPWHDMGKERLNPDYWREVDARLAFANSRGLTVGLALAWGQKVGDEKYPWARFPHLEARKRYARYIAARFAAYDVYFIVSGEWHGEVKTRKSTEREMKREFIEIGDALRAADPHGRMIGIHPMTEHGSTREFADSKWMSFADYQQNYWELHERVVQSRSAAAKPVVNSEYAYFLRDANDDGIVDKHHSYTLDDIRHASWDIAMAGGYFITGYGSTYMGGSRHNTDFSPDEPANEPWTRQLAVLRDTFRALEYWKLEPHDELLTCATPRSAGRYRKVEVNDRQRTMNQTSATTYWCLAEPGSQYLVYLRGLRETLTVQLKPGFTAKATLLDSRTGERKELKTSPNEARLSFQPPNEEDWLVVIR
jgi:hypothetical protein